MKHMRPAILQIVSLFFDWRAISDFLLNGVRIYGFILIYGFIRGESYT